MLNSAYQKALKNATVCWHQGQSRQPINFLPHHHHHDDNDDCAVAALNSLCCLSIVQNIYKKKKDAEQVEGREWGEKHETALSMSAIARAGGVGGFGGAYTATSGRSEWLTFHMEAIASASVPTTTVAATAATHLFTPNWATLTSRNGPKKYAT